MKSYYLDVLLVYDWVTLIKFGHNDSGVSFDVSLRNIYIYFISYNKKISDSLCKSHSVECTGKSIGKGEYHTNRTPQFRTQSAWNHKVGTTYNGQDNIFICNSNNFSGNLILALPLTRGDSPVGGNSWYWQWSDWGYHYRHEDDNPSGNCRMNGWNDMSPFEEYYTE